MLEMTLSNGDIENVKPDFPDGSTLKELALLFDGDMAYDQWLCCLYYYDPDASPSDDDDHVFKVESVKWDFSDGQAFDEYIAEWLNGLDSIAEIGDLFHGGIQSGITQLVWTKECRRVFVKYLDSIEEIISQIAENMDEETFYSAIFKEGLDIDKLTQCCFEERLRWLLEVELGLEL